MSKSDAMENGMLLLFFNNTDFALVGDAGGLRGSVTPNSFHLSMHTASPAEDGDQETNEISYTGYVRAAVARSGAGFTVTTNAVTNAAIVPWPEMTGGAGGTATYVGVGTATTGAGVLLYYCLVTDPVAGLPVTLNITPKVAAGALDITEN